MKRPRDRCNKCVEMRKLRPLEALEENNAYPRYSRRQEGLIKTLSAPQSVKCFYATPTLTEESRRGAKMVWFERYAMRFVCPLICLFPEEVDTEFNDIEIVFDAYGN